VDEHILCLVVSSDLFRTALKASTDAYCVLPSAHAAKLLQQLLPASEALADHQSETTSLHLTDKGAARPRRQGKALNSSSSVLVGDGQSTPEYRVNDTSKRAYTVLEAARIYSISRSTIYNLIAEGALPDVTVNGRRLLPRDAMESLIAGKRK
jgi:excisionase family DNA binding protein